MSLMKLLGCKQKNRKLNKKDLLYIDKKNELIQSHEAVKNLISSDFNFISMNKKQMILSLESDFNEELSKLKELRKSALSKSLLLPKELMLQPYITSEVKGNGFDLISAISSAPRIKVEKLKEIADKLNYCIFDEKVFHEKNEAENSIAASEMAVFLKSKDYNIYYLSPLSGFDYNSFIKSGSGIYDIESYWGNHFQVFNSLALSVNVFRDIFEELKILREETNAIKKHIVEDRKRVDDFHNQFKNYVDHIQKNLRILEKPLNEIIANKNTELKKSFKNNLHYVLKNNEKYKNNRFRYNEYYQYYEKDSKTNEYIKIDESIYYDSDNDYKMVKMTDVIDNWLPVPTKPKYYDHFYAKEFKINELSTAAEIQEFTNSYSLINLRKLLMKELSNNYVMIASKGNITDVTDDLIVLSSWGEGFSEESLIALGVK